MVSIFSFCPVHVIAVKSTSAILKSLDTLLIVRTNTVEHNSTSVISHTRSIRVGSFMAGADLIVSGAEPNLS